MQRETEGCRHFDPLRIGLESALEIAPLGQPAVGYTEEKRLLSFGASTPRDESQGLGLRRIGVGGPGLREDREKILSFFDLLQAKR
jgi:hypothetical protein